MQTQRSIMWLTRRVTYPGHSARIIQTAGGWFFQWAYFEPDALAPGVPLEQRTRKWYISQHATDTEVIQTMLAAALASAEHRVREHFLVDGVRAYKPHYMINELVAFCRNSSEDSRAPAAPFSAGSHPHLEEQ